MHSMEILIAILGVISALIGLASVVIGQRKVHEVRARSETSTRNDIPVNPSLITEALTKLVSEDIAPRHWMWDNHAIAFTGYCLVVGMLSGATMLGSVGGLVGWLGSSNMIAFTVGALVVGALACMTGFIVDDPVLDPMEKVVPFTFVGGIVGGLAGLALFKAQYLGSGRLTDFTPGQGMFWGCLAGSIVGILVSAAVGYTHTLRRFRERH
jgi:hypothetical protein